MHEKTSQITDILVVDFFDDDDPTRAESIPEVTQGKQNSMVASSILFPNRLSIE